MLKYNLTLRLSGADKHYNLKQIEAFCSIDFGDKVKLIEFGKQDPFAAPSITFFDTDNSRCDQRHFKNNRELITFVEGYVQAHSKINEFKLN